MRKMDLTAILKKLGIIFILGCGAFTYQNCSGSLDSKYSPRGTSLPSPDLTPEEPTGDNSPENPEPSEGPSFPENVKIFGYFQAYTSDEMAATSDHVNTVIIEGGDYLDKLANAKQLGLKVFLNLSTLFFVPSNYSLVEFASEDVYLSKWNEAAPKIKEYADIIEAFVPIDEPEFTFFPGTRSDRPGGRVRTRARCLEIIAELVRKDIPNAKMAINFWGNTVNGWSTDMSDFIERYPTSYDYVGTALYEQSFQSAPYVTLLNLTENLPSPPSIYLIPKAFFTEDSYFPQEDGETGIIEKHLVQSLEFASQNPRVRAIFPFVWRSFDENGHRMRGTNELPEVQAALFTLGKSLKVKRTSSL